MTVNNVFKFVISTAGLLLSPTVTIAAEPEPVNIIRPEPQNMTSAEIKAFNANVPVEHRYFIVCQRTKVTGSLVKKVRTCMTREDLDRLARAAQDETNEKMNQGRVQRGCVPYCTGSD